MNYTRTIRIKPDELKEMQDFLNSKGEDKVNTIKTYTANFGDNGEGVIEVDIKVCQGDPPYVDAVLFQDGHEVGCLEPEGDLVGEYVFTSFMKDVYTVIVEEGETMKYELQQVGLPDIIGYDKHGNPDIKNIPDGKWDTILASDDKESLLDSFIEALNREQTCSFETYFRIVEKNEEGETIETDNDKCPKCGEQNIKANYTEKGTVTLLDGSMDPGSMTGDETEVYGPYECYECGHKWDD